MADLSAGTPGGGSQETLNRDRLVCDVSFANGQVFLAPSFEHKTPTVEAVIHSVKSLCRRLIPFFDLLH